MNTNSFLVVGEILVKMLKTTSPKKIAFYLDYSKYNRDEAPTILQFVQLLKNVGHEVDFSIDKEELLEKVASRNYDVVAVSILSSIELKENLITVIKVKEVDPRVVVVVGGHGVEDNAIPLSNAVGIDVVVEGEGDLVFPLILEYLKRAPENEELKVPLEESLKFARKDVDFLGEELIELISSAQYKSPITEKQADCLKNIHIKRKIKGIEISFPLSGVIVNSRNGKHILKVDSEEAYEESKRAWEEENKEEFPIGYKEFSRNLYTYPSRSEMEDLPLDFPWDEIKKRKWDGLSLYVQRGCNWGKCSYCSVSNLPGRRYPVGKVLNVIEKAAENGLTRITFEDDHFVQNRRWVENLLDKIRLHGLSDKLIFGAMVRVESIDYALLKKFKEANFRKLQIGVESFVLSKIKYFKKTSDGCELNYIKKSKEIISMCLREGIIPGVFIITTRPKAKNALSEVSEELLLVSDIIKGSINYPVLPIFSFSDVLMAYPNSALINSDEYNKTLVPLRVIRDGNKARVEYLEIPYIFRLKSMALANFLGIQAKIGRRRGMPPELLNETWEHIDDLCQALEIAVEHLVTPIGTALEFIGEMKKEGKRNCPNLVSKLAKEGNIVCSDLSDIEMLILSGKVSPETFLKTVMEDGSLEMRSRIREIFRESALEKESVHERCSRIMKNLREAAGKLNLEINEYLSLTKQELVEAERAKNSELALQKTEEIRRKTITYIEKIYPYLGGRRTLQLSLIHI